MLLRRATLCGLVLFALLAGACARAPRPLATEDERPRASAQGTTVLGQRISRDTPESEVTVVDRVDDRAEPVVEEPVQQPGRLLAFSTFPFAPTRANPRIDGAQIVCTEDALEVWVQVSPVEGAPAGDSDLAVRVSLRLPDGPVPVLFVANGVANSQAPLQIVDWGSFPGDPADRPDLLGQLCVEAAWPMVIAVSDAEGNELRGALTVPVREAGWVDAHTDVLVSPAPAADVAAITAPWLDPLTGIFLRSVHIVCEGGTPQPQLDVVTVGSPVLAPRQWVALAVTPEIEDRGLNRTDWVSAHGAAFNGQLSTIDGWVGEEPPPAQVCDDAAQGSEKRTWPLWVRLFDGVNAVFEGVLDVEVVDQG